jgi:hypothetical protein
MAVEKTEPSFPSWYHSPNALAGRVRHGTGWESCLVTHLDMVRVCVVIGERIESSRLAGRKAMTVRART